MRLTTINCAISTTLTEECWASCVSPTYTLLMRLPIHIHFMAHVMTYGTAEDVPHVKAVVEAEAFLETLTHAPPGIFDARSWAYWNLKFGRANDLPRPRRQFAD